MKFRITVLAILLLAFASSCTTKKAETKKKMNKDVVLDEWLLKTTQGKTFETEQIPLLMLNAETMEFSGNNGCNSIFGSLKTFTKDELQFGQINSTRISCGDMKLPEIFDNLIRQVRFYEMNDNTLLLKDENKTILLQFSKKS